MKATVMATALTIALALPVSAAEEHCDNDIKKVDEAIADAKLDDEALTKVKAARDAADEFHTAEKFEECEAALKEAQLLLGLKDGHDH